MAGKVAKFFCSQAASSNRLPTAIEVLIQPVERTLTDEDFEALTAKIVANVEKTTGGVLRA